MLPSWIWCFPLARRSWYPSRRPAGWDRRRDSSPSHPTVRARAGWSSAASAVPSGPVVPFHFTWGVAMTDLEQGELRVVVPVGFLLAEEQEVTVSVDRPDG